jgi:hypothetical protein
MINPKVFLLIVFLLFYNSGFCQDKEVLAFTELRAGYGFGTSIVVYMGQIELERKLKKFEAISFSFEYFFSRLNGGATYIASGTTYTINYPVWEKFVFANINWHPIRTVNQPFSWLFISGGVGYTQQNFLGSLSNNGPGIKGTLGVQYTFINKLTVSTKIQYFYYYNLNMEDPARIKATGVPFMISIGYRFFGRTNE